MTDLYETIVAETPFEANIIAEERYGKNYEVVKTDTVKEKTFWGYKEMVRITVRPFINHFNSHMNQNNYSLQNHSTPNQLDSLSHYSDNNSLKETQSSYEPRQVSVPINVAKNNYRKAQSKLRMSIDGIHDIQEENVETKSEKITNNKDYSELRDDLLESINELRNGRKKDRTIAGEIKNNSITSRKLEELQEKIELLTATVSKMAQNSNNFLKENQLPQGLYDVEKELQDIETPQEIIKELFRDLRLNCDKETLCKSKDTYNAIHSLIKNKLSISSEFEIKKSSAPQVIVLMGPTGVGKTTTIAKLAAKFCFNTEKPIKACFLNIDFYKLGAKDQLQKYADIFQIPLEDISSIASLDYFLNKHKDDDLIIVDTAGRSQYAHEDLEELKAYVSRIPNATKYLTVSSTSKYSDLKEIVASFGRIGFDHIILTKTDETKTIGPAVGMLLKSNKSLAYITHGQAVPEDYRIADFDFFEEKIFHSLQNFNNHRQVL